MWRVAGADERRPRFRILYIAHYCRPDEAAWISTEYLLKCLRFTNVVENAVVLTNDPHAYRAVLHAPEKLRNWMQIIHVAYPIALEARQLGKLLRALLSYLLVFLVAMRTCKKMRITHIFTQHHNYHLASCIGVLLSRLLSLPCIIKIQDGIPYIGGRNLVERILNHYIMKLINRMAFKRATLILNLSSERAKLLTRIFHIPRSKMAVFSNMIDSENFSKIDEEFKRRFIKRYALKGKIMLFIGVTSGRGLERLVKALPKIASEIGDVKFVIVGHAPDEDELRRIARSLGVESALVFVAPVSHKFIPSLISMADVCIGPLAVHWFSVADVQRKVLEYMACGRPTVAAEFSVTRDLLIDGKTGILIKKPEDHEELSRKIVKVLRDEELKRRLGLNAMAKVKKLYDCRSPTMIERLRAILLNTYRKPKG
ncbi:MAG: hypothetical protein DRN06_09295 [Thermoprotei archaeon]|nr:MAG: hypothetical protein DRN06_09295 [Thermoprotei archaeon]